MTTEALMARMDAAYAAAETAWVHAIEDAFWCEDFPRWCDELDRQDLARGTPRVFDGS